MFKKAIDKNPELINIGKKWSQEEESLLLQRIKENKSHNDISIEFKRTHGGSTSHIKQLAIKYYNDEEPIEIIQNITGLSKEIIMEAVENEKNKKLNKSSKKKLEKDFTDVSIRDSSIADTVATQINEITLAKPKQYLLNEQQQAVLEEVLQGKNVFITGPGGPGQTFLLREIQRQLEAKNKNVAITSLTGMAALLIGKGARTIHSWAGIATGTRSVDDMFEFIRKCQPKVRDAWRSTNTLIIDEISMMSDEMFEKLDQLGRRLRWKPNVPFGGIQIICLGDFYQLPPINTKFVFETALWEEIIETIVVLDTIYRQKDPVFQKILNEVRVGKVSDETDSILKSRLNLDFSKETIQPTKIFTRRDMVDKVNKECFDKISGEVYTYKLTTKGKATTDAIKNAIKKMDASAQYVETLSLKIGAQVMLITNIDQEAGLVNGKVGIVTKIKKAHTEIIEKENKHGIMVKVLVNIPEKICVRFKDGYEEDIGFHEWQIDDYENVHRCQIPLILAYAITTHKSQGATLESAYIDIGRSVFEYGQAYVALSRVKSINALYLHDYDRKAIRAHPKVIEYYTSLLE
jgi:ATP-dependent DNA helicase PIF1